MTTTFAHYRPDASPSWGAPCGEFSCRSGSVVSLASWNTRQRPLLIVLSINVLLHVCFHKHPILIYNYSTFVMSAGLASSMLNEVFHWKKSYYVRHLRYLSVFWWVGEWDGGTYRGEWVSEMGALTTVNRWVRWGALTVVSGWVRWRALTVVSGWVRWRALTVVSGWDAGHLPWWVGEWDGGHLPWWVGEWDAGHLPWWVGE